MPNWCQNVAYIDHEDKQKIDFMVEELDKKEPQLFNSVMPRPVEEEENWYDWNVANWGTKWDVSFDSIERVNPNTVQASFDSAWAPPTVAYERLIDLGFYVKAYYYEPGMCFAGMWMDGWDTAR